MKAFRDREKAMMAESSLYASSFCSLHKVRDLRREAQAALREYQASRGYLKTCAYLGRLPKPELRYRHELAEAWARETAWVFTAYWVFLPDGSWILASPEAARLFPPCPVRRAKVPGGPKHRIPRSRDPIRDPVPMIEAV